MKGFYHQGTKDTKMHQENPDLAGLILVPLGVLGVLVVKVFQP